MEVIKILMVSVVSVSNHVIHVMAVLRQIAFWRSVPMGSLIWLMVDARHVPSNVQPAVVAQVKTA